MARMIDGDKLVENLRLIATCWSISPFVSKEKHNGAVDMLREVEREVKEAPTLTPPNEPLTLEQLREMDGQPVYVVPENEYSELGGWCVISADDSDDYSCALVPGTDCWRWSFEAYGEQWLAYRRPPEGEEDT